MCHFYKRVLNRRRTDFGVLRTYTVDAIPVEVVAEDGANARRRSDRFVGVRPVHELHVLFIRTRSKLRRGCEWVPLC